MPVIIEMSVSESIESEEDDIPDQSELQLWADKACLCDDQVTASVQIVSSSEMQELNRTWRGKDKPTNVLSFPMQSSTSWPEEAGINTLGDIALCAKVINTEAREQHKSLDAHWAHMIVHGMLHLQGYDHIEENEAEKMETLEVRLLSELGYDNPYREISG